MIDDMDIYLAEANSAECEIAKLKQQVTDLKNAIANDTNWSFEAPELTELRTHNVKLKNRLSILNRAIMSEINKSDSEEIVSTGCIQDELKHSFTAAIAAAFPDLTDLPTIITLGKSSKFGDYQCNSAHPIANILKQSGKNVPPKDIAKEIVNHMPLCELIDKLEIANAGFINIFLSREPILRKLTLIFEQGLKPPAQGKKLRVLVDFSSPNIAKEMHVGHLRSTIIGDSICRLLEYLGHDVLRINHVGDWGTQFGMLLAHLQDTFPNYLSDTPSIGDLQAFYKQSKIRFDTDDEFKKRGYECVVKLQKLDPDHIKGWELICDISRREFQKVYDRLQIKLTERGESFYQTRMETIVEELKKGGYLEDDDGRKIMWGEKDVGVPLIIEKTGGGFTYDTSDMAAIKQRLEEEKCDWIIYVTDAGQATHFETIFKCAKRIGILDPTKHRIDHVGFGVVQGEDNKKFKTRSGENIRLVDLLDEGLKRALDKLTEKEREKVLTADELRQAQESVAYGCIKYNDLSHNRIHEYAFSFDKMLMDKGNTAVYLFYAYTRIKSIARTANYDQNKIKEIAKTTQISLDHEKEFKLGIILARFDEVLLRITNDLSLHSLCEYLYDVATAFSEFYDNCYCIVKDSSGDIVKVHNGRILLAEVTSIVMAKGFNILGLVPVSRM